MKTVIIQVTPYDYLKEIGQYTGWTYEFVEPQDSGTIDEQLIQMMDMLEQGELDLIGAMNNNNQTSSVYDFPVKTTATHTV